MEAIALCSFFLATMVHGDVETLCGGKSCSAAQDCVNNQCVCTQIHCRIGCRYGFKRDENGCEYSCTCAKGFEKRQN
uniref:Hirustasin-like factor 3 n=1 Tax=Hirudo verbana TaxID=311461 RepID=A0A7T0PAG2_9ANNE|nr:hirustasin-like factor 3 [Hirudo verbana]